jgi:hypothetical protein
VNYSPPGNDLGRCALPASALPCLSSLQLFIDQEKLLCWIVRRLNSRAHHSVVCNVVIAERMSLLCRQETKVHNFPVAWIYDVMGTDFGEGSSLPGAAMFISSHRSRA